jgi:NADH dehydrogenase
MNDPIRVLCLGGGWAAYELARSLRPAIRRHEIELTVVSRGSTIATHGLMAELVTCKVRPEQMASPLAPLLAPAKLVTLDVETIDIERRTVYARSIAGGLAVALPYDELVIALGSVDDPLQMAAGAKHCFALKTFEDGCRLRSHLLRMGELAGAEADPAVRRELLTFVVAGGNYTGVEVACEIFDFMRCLLPRAMANDGAAGPRVIVVEKGQGVLRDLAARSPQLANYAVQRIQSLGIEVLTERAVVEASKCGVTLSDGSDIKARTIIRCTGTTACPQVAKLPVALDPCGRLNTDEFMRISGADHLWAAGDCASVPHPYGGTCPPMALFAREGGRLIGRNLILKLQNRPMVPNWFTGLGEACTLGHRCAVGQMKGMPVFGLAAWLGFRAIVWAMFAPGWERKKRLALDWLRTALFGRNTSPPTALQSSQSDVVQSPETTVDRPEAVPLRPI